MWKRKRFVFAALFFSLGTCFSQAQTEVWTDEVREVFYQLNEKGNCEKAQEKWDEIYLSEFEVPEPFLQLVPNILTFYCDEDPTMLFQLSMVSDSLCEVAKTSYPKEYELLDIPFFQFLFIEQIVQELPESANLEEGQFLERENRLIQNYLSDRYDLILNHHSAYAQFYRFAFNNEKAVYHYQEAYRIIQEYKILNADVYDFLMSYTSFEMNAGNLEFAGKLLEQGKRVYRKLGIKYYSEEEELVVAGQEAHLLILQGRPDKALLVLESALEKSEQIDEGYSLPFLYQISGRCYELLDEPEEAEKYYILSHQYYAASERGEDGLQSSANLAAFYLRSDQTQKAFDVYTAAFKALDTYIEEVYPGLLEQQQLDFTKGLQDFNDAFFSFAHVHHTEFPEAELLVARVSLLSKGLIFRYSKARHKQYGQSPDREIKMQWERYQKAVHMQANAYRYSLKSRDLIRPEEEEKKLLALEKPRGDEKWKLGIMELGKNLEDSSVIIDWVYYFHFERKGNYEEEEEEQPYYAAIVYEPGKLPKWLYSISEKDLIDGFEQSSSQGVHLALRGVGEMNEVSGADYTLLWKPFESVLKDKKKVYICPSGVLSNFPFHLLKDPGGTYFIQDYSLVYLSNLMELNAGGSDEINADSLEITLLGGANFNELPDLPFTIDSPWKYLPGTQNEVTGLSEQLAEIMRIRRIDGNQFTEDTLYRLGKTDILHISTHGYQNAFKPLGQFFESVNPMLRSGLVAGGGNFGWNQHESLGMAYSGEDGIITAQEIVHSDFNHVRLLVLSACETAKGESFGNEGLFGLSRAFKLAGAQYMILSLWPVSDQATVLFMETFYRKLHECGQIEKAFCLTQRELLKNQPEADWSPFILLL